LSESEPAAAQATGIALPTPDHPELPAEVLQAFIEVDRKCAVFIFPQLAQLGAAAAVEELVAAATVMAETASEGAHAELAAGYRELLGRAQLALREARTAEAHNESKHRDQRQNDARLTATLLNAKSRLPAARLARLQQRLAEMAEQESGDPAVVVEAAVTEWERLSQVRQSREAERLADRAHLAVRPRQLETARSRKALRDQAKVVELARAFTMPEPDSEESVSSEQPDQ
jgi:hypothetical protein